MAGLPSDKIVECHGTYYTAHCQKCQKEYDLSEIKGTMEKCQIPKCSSCIDGFVKPEIVFFGENLPEKFFKLSKSDFKDCHLLIIIGISLQVCPVNYCTSYVGIDVLRVLINNEVVNTYNEELKLIV